MNRSESEAIDRHITGDYGPVACSSLYPGTSIPCELNAGHVFRHTAKVGVMKNRLEWDES